MKTIGKWWNDRNIDLVVIDDEIYALNGWNGEFYLDCWKCLDHYTAADDQKYRIKEITEQDGENINLVGYELA